MRDGEDVDGLLEREVEPATCAVAVSRDGDAGDALLSERGEHGADAGLREVNPVAAKPRPEIEGDAGIEAVGRAGLLEEIRHDDAEAIAREVIREQLQGRGETIGAEHRGIDGGRTHLVVDELVSEDVRQIQDRLVLSVLALRGRYIALDAGDLLDLAWSTGRAV